jgi:hypothetical protein
VTDTLETTSLGTIDFSVVEDFKLLPAGKYPGQTLGEVEVKPASNGKTTNINVKCKMQYEDTDEETGDTIVKSRSITSRYNTHPDALFRIKRDMIALGEDPAALKAKDVNLGQLVNKHFAGGAGNAKPIWIHLIQRPYTPEGATEAEIRNEVAKIELRETDGDE